jgi:hypothetical protein
MDSHHAVVDLAPAAVPLPRDTNRVAAAFGNAGFIHHADGVRMRMALGHNLLATVMEFLFIPLDVFQESL